MLLTNLFKPWTLIRNSMQLQSGSLTMDPPDDQTWQLESHLKLKNLGLGRAKCFVIRRCLLEMEAPSLINKPAGVQQCKARQSRSCNAVQLCAMEWTFKQADSHRNTQWQDPRCTRGALLERTRQSSQKTRWHPLAHIIQLDHQTALQYFPVQSSGFGDHWHCVDQCGAEQGAGRHNVECMQGARGAQGS